MAKYIKVSTIGLNPAEASDHRDYKRYVENMKSRWGAVLSNVLPDKPDLIVLPEICDRFLGMSGEDLAAYYHERGNNMRDFFASVAAENRCCIAYSAECDNGDGTFRNATQLLDRGGNVIGVYNKNHPIISEITDLNMLCGKDAPTIKCDFGPVACVICFDLNFSDILEKYKESRPKIILFSSLYHGGIVQNYWAYACQSYFVGACAGLPCAILSPLGDVIGESSVHEPYVTRSINLNYKIVHTDGNMDRLHAAKRRYGPKIRISTPGLHNMVMLTSETEEFAVDKVIEEFHIETWDNYYRRSLDFEALHTEA